MKMIRWSVISILLAWSAFLHAQSRTFEDQVWDFGEVAFWNNDTAWFTVRNATEKDLMFLPTYYNEKYQVIFSSRVAASGESLQVGIVYYTSRAGKFNEALPLFINQRGEPIIFRLKGNIKGFNPEAQLRCPVVNGDRTENRTEKVITLEVRNAHTDELITPDMLSVKTRYNQTVKLERSDLEYEMIASPGAYRVSAGKKGYDEYLALITLEPYQLRFVVYLEPQSEVPEFDNTPEIEPTAAEDPILIEPPPEKHTHRDSSVTTAPGVLTSDYKLNNIILIIDVSSSMNRGGKSEMLRNSFNIMVDALRPDDIVGVVSMNSVAEIVQDPTGVTERDSLKLKVAEMKSLGGTNGGAAIQLAYKLAKEHYIPGGNNQVIIATDGVFYNGSLTRREIEALITSGNSENIHFSSVAFGSDHKALLFMATLSDLGGGTFVHMAGNAADEPLLLEMLKSQSLSK